MTTRRVLWIACALGLAGIVVGCHEDPSRLRAKRVEREDELIGGPQSMGEVGDFLIENDRVRAIITGPGHSWGVGLFGGSLIDIDRRRPEGQFLNGQGLDQFAEMFPTVNLVTSDPDQPVRQLQNSLRSVAVWQDPQAGTVRAEDRQVRWVDQHVTGVYVLSDGSDGMEASVAAEGRGAFLFEALGLLQSPMLSLFLKDLKVGFDFKTTYALRPGESLMRIRTTVHFMPTELAEGCPGLPGDDCSLACPVGYATEDLPVKQDPQTGAWSAAACPTCQCQVYKPQGQSADVCANAIVYRPDPAQPDQGYPFCRLREQPTQPCPDITDRELCECGCPAAAFAPESNCEQSGGYRFDPIEVPVADGEPGETKTAYCPVCACDGRSDLPPYTESSAIFSDIIGELPPPFSPGPQKWLPGVIAGDFLFFGKACNIFAPGLGFDEDRRIFENTWEGIGTISNPLSMDFVAAVGDRVSYGLFSFDPTQDPDQPPAIGECPTQRLALTHFEPRPQHWNAATQRFEDVLDRHQRRTVRAGLRQTLVDDFDVASDDVAKAQLTALRIEQTPLVLKTLETRCYNGRDDDLDGLSDCDDPDCAGVLCDYQYEDCEQKQPCPAVAEPPDPCDQDQDGDCDGIDVALAEALAAFDAGLSAAYVAEGECQDRYDNDGDGLTDCADPDCGTPLPTSAAACTAGTADERCNARGCGRGEADCATGTADSPCCHNGTDDDGDGVADCDDPQCSSAAACLKPVAEAADLLQLSLVPAPQCQPAKVLIPLFTTSATAVITHGKRCAAQPKYGDTCAGEQTMTYERYLAVGDGDVASVLEALYTLRGDQTGMLRGGVLEAGTMTPVPHADVFVLRLPVTPPAPPADNPLGEPVDPDGDTQDADFMRVGFAWRDLMNIHDPYDLQNPVNYDMLVQANEKRWGNMGVLSHIEADKGSDPRLDGDFSGQVKPGYYAVVARGKDTSASALNIVRIRAGQTSEIYPLIPPPGQVSYRVYDETGALSHAKLVFVALDTAGEECTWDGQPAREEQKRLCMARRHVELGDGRIDDGVRKVFYAPFGQGNETIQPGRYNVYVSRGIEFSIDVIRNFEVLPGRTVTLEAHVQREIDSSGWVAGDFHLHSAPSFDGGVSIENRLASNLVEGLELVTSTDHDVVIDYAPYLHKLGFDPYLKSQVGVELTTMEFGHWNGYPLSYEGTRWPAHGAPDWVGKDNQQIVDMLRERGEYGPQDTVVQCNHPRDGFMGYLDQLGLNLLDMNREVSLFEQCNPQTERVSCDFDAMEIMNEKRFELIRSPTIAEHVQFADCDKFIQQSEDNEDLIDILGNGVEVPDTPCAWAARLPYADSDECADDFCPDQTANDALPGGGLDPQCRAACRQRQADRCVEQQCRWPAISDAALTEALTKACTARCREQSERDELRRPWHQQFREAILGDDGQSHCTDPSVRLLDCKRYALEGLKHLGVRYDLERTPAEQKVLMSLKPELDPDCKLDAALKGCTAKPERAGCPGCMCEQCVCEHSDLPGLAHCCGDGGSWDDACVAACDWLCNGCQALQPCLDYANILDDWFKFLNMGMTVTGVGNSDSHDLLYEGGIPRTFVRSSTDNPAQIDVREINRNIRAHKAFFSSGPFVRFQMFEDRGATADIGETLVLRGDGPVRAQVEVTTPSWFGVEYIEVYRNGQLELVSYPGRDYPADAPSDKPSDIVDFSAVIDFAKPAADSWYLVLAYGLNDPYELSPVYFSIPYGKILLPTVIEMGFSQIFASMGPAAGSLLQQFGIGGGTLPERFPTIPFAATNPIFVDVDGDGWKAPEQRNREAIVRLDDGRSKTCTLLRDEAGQVLAEQSDCAEGETCADDCVPETDGDGNIVAACDDSGYCLGSEPALPPFCSQPCALKRSPDGMVRLEASDCGLNQVCADDGNGDDVGLCIIPLDLDNCPSADPAATFLGKTGQLATRASALTLGASASSAAADRSQRALFLRALSHKFLQYFITRCGR